MSDYFEIDFLDVESDNGGDAITLRYKINEETYIHVVDGGYQSTGEKIVESINNYYGTPTYIDNVILTHQDNDHAGGLRTVLETYNVGSLWMHRPWLYANEIIDRFSRFKSIENLIERLKEIYPNIAVLEELADSKHITIREPFQGAKIGAFTVLSPTKDMYLDLIVNSDKTPEAKIEEVSSRSFMASLIEGVRFIRSLWGGENFPDEGTSCENEMSVIQYAKLCDNTILLTGDAGREALTIAANYSPSIGLTLPGIDRFQVPHHGSRHNVSSQILDRWIGPKLSAKPQDDVGLTTAMISASSKDDNHPRKVVVRSLIHRGAKVISTKGKNICTYQNAQLRPGWSPLVPMEYPDEQEE
jgi:beta-lactamase superfamily II metal-dependent hydrolase